MSTVDACSPICSSDRWPFLWNGSATFGRIDILVNNAGITRDDLILRMTDQAWREVLDVNLTGAFNMTRAVLRPMLKARSGRIINMSSVSGHSPRMSRWNDSPITGSRGSASEPAICRPSTGSVPRSNARCRARRAGDTVQLVQVDGTPSRTYGAPGQDQPLVHVDQPARGRR